jgi:cobalt-zinc-cadmium resistance protein CzcA
MQVIQDSTLEVRGAAVFGEIIIAIVYLPILALTGMEGKLFHPMAYTVLLALGGAFIFSLTVVPVLTSYFVKPHPDERETLLIRAVHRIYTPALHLALRWRWATMTVGLMALAAASRCSAASGRSSSPSSTRATCWSRRAGCPGRRSRSRSRRACGSSAP